MGYGVFEAKSLHYISHNAYLFRQSNLEHMQQYLLGSGWFRDASSTDFLSASRVHNNVYYFDLCYLVKDLSGLVTQMGPLAELTEGFPNNKRKETDEDMGLNTLFLLMPDWAKLQIVLLDAKGRFCFG